MQVWYKKRTDPQAIYIVTQCGLEDVYDFVGNVLHEDDLEMVRIQLFNVSKDTMFQIFEKITI